MFYTTLYDLLAYSRVSHLVPYKVTCYMRVFIAVVVVMQRYKEKTWKINCILREHSRKMLSRDKKFKLASVTSVIPKEKLPKDLNFYRRDF